MHYQRDLVPRIQSASLTPNSLHCNTAEMHTIKQPLERQTGRWTNEFALDGFTQSLLQSQKVQDLLVSEPHKSALWLFLSIGVITLCFLQSHLEASAILVVLG